MCDALPLTSLINCNFLSNANTLIAFDCPRGLFLVSLLTGTDVVFRIYIKYLSDMKLVGVCGINKCHCDINVNRDTFYLHRFVIK